LKAANAELAAHALQAEELAAARERSRMAREIHDLIGHHLTVVRVQLEAALSLHASNPCKALEAVRNARECAGEGLREIRNSVESLRAGPLENRSLCEALLSLVTESERAGQRVHLVVEGSERPVSPATALTVYRAAQEALTNARKHVPNARVTLELAFTSRNEVILKVSDDGPGPPENFTPGFGLTGLHERTALIGGSLVLKKDSNAGFSFALTLPA
jgi:signal transduction histidine kinase